MRAILGLDFLEFAKRPRYFVARSISVGLPVLYLGLLWLFSRTANADGDLGQEMFATVAWPILIVAALVSPSMVAPILVEERQNNRLEVLQSTPLSAAQIVVGRWLSRVALAWSMVIAALPLAAGCLLFGGVDPNDFYVVAVIALLTVPLVSSVALCVSAGGRDSGVVLRVTYSVILALYFLLVFLSGPASAMLRTMWLPVFDEALQCLSWLNPFLVLPAATSGIGGGVVAYPIDPLLAFVVSASTLTAVLVAWSIYRFSRPLGRRGNAGVKPGESVALESDGRGVRAPHSGDRTVGSSAGDVAFVVGERRRGRFSTGLRRLWRNPPLWLELKRSSLEIGPVRRLSLFAVVAFLETCLLVVLLLAHDQDRRTMQFHLVPLAVTFAFCILSIATIGATAVHRDGQANTRDVLHASPLENRDLAIAKVGAALRSGLVWFALLAAHLVLGVAFGDIAVSTATLTLILVCGMLFSLAAFSVRFGMTARSLNRASVRVLGVVIAHVVLSPMVFGMLGFAAAAGGAGDSGLAFFLGHHPLVIVGFPIMTEASGGVLAVGLASRFVGAYFLGYVFFGVYATYRSIPRHYAKIRDDLRWVPREMGSVERGDQREERA